VAETPTTTPEVTASPGPCSRLAVTLELADTDICPGEIFWLRAHICSPDADRYQVPFVALLDIGVGEYWFFPSWRHWPPDIDWLNIDLTMGVEAVLDVLPPFTWPDTGSGVLNGIYFHSALLNNQMSAILGEFDSVSFGYGPCQ